MFDTILKEQFGEYYQVSAKTIDDDSIYRNQTIIQIIHENRWKDVWIDEDNIVSIIHVHPDCMGNDELNIWKDLCDQGIVN